MLTFIQYKAQSCQELNLIKSSAQSKAQQTDIDGIAHTRLKKKIKYVMGTQDLHVSLLFTGSVTPKLIVLIIYLSQSTFKTKRLFLLTDSFCFTSS